MDFYVLHNFWFDFLDERAKKKGADRNDRFLGNAVHIGGGVWSPRPTGARHGVRCERDVEDAVPYGRIVGGRADGTMWASSPTKNL